MACIILARAALAQTGAAPGGGGDLAGSGGDLYKILGGGVGGSAVLLLALKALSIAEKAIDARKNGESDQGQDNSEVQVRLPPPVYNERVHEEHFRKLDKLFEVARGAGGTAEQVKGICDKELEGARTDIRALDRKIDLMSQRLDDCIIEFRRMRDGQ